MYLTVASLLLSATWILWNWAYTAHRRPVPAAWTRYEAASIAAVIAWVTFLAVGTGALVAALVSPIETLRDQTLVSVLVTLAAPVLAAKARPRLRAPLVGPKTVPSQDRAVAG